MKKRYDFIIGYEHKNREIESICLLVHELKKRGYSVMVYNVFDYKIKQYWYQYYTEVLILPYCYDEDSVASCVEKAIVFNKIINLQWEQVLYKSHENNPDGCKNPTGINKKAMHLAWGKANVDRLIRLVGINEKNVELVGNIALDLLKNPISDYFLSREEVLKMYDIPTDKKICLCIGSFKCAFLEGQALEADCRHYGEGRRELHDVSLKSFFEIISWIEMALEKDADLFFIYRPHPGEQLQYSDKIKKRLREIREKTNRFVVIDELSVKQWILISDLIYVGISTVLAEVFFAKKKCFILYPYEMPEQMMMKIFDHANFIKNFTQMLQSLYEEDIQFPIPEEDLNEYYMTENGMSYIRIADVCERVYADDYYKLTTKEKRFLNKFKFKELTFGDKLILTVLQIKWLNNLWERLINSRLSIPFLEKRRCPRRWYSRWAEKELVLPDELMLIEKKVCKSL